MFFKKVFLVSLIMLLSLSFFGAYTSVAADFPEREIRVIVPWGPGGSTDIMARKLQEIFKTQFDVDIVVENIEGGSSAVGLAQVLTSKPNGYTVGLASSTIISLMAQNEVDFTPDNFTNIIAVSEDPLVLAVKKDSQWDDFEYFMEYMKNNPGEIDIGTSGAKNVNHALAELLAISADTEINQVSYDGGSRVISEVMGGHIHGGVLKPSEVMTYVEDDELTPLGVFRDKRLDVFPEAPTFPEKGYQVFDVGNVAQITYAVAPAGLNSDIKNEVTNLFKKVIKTDEFQQFAKEYGFLAEGISGEELNDFVNDIYVGMEKVSEEAF